MPQLMHHSLHRLRLGLAPKRMRKLKRVPTPLLRAVIIPRRRLRARLLPIISLLPVLRHIRNHQRIRPPPFPTNPLLLIIERDRQRGKRIHRVRPLRHSLQERKKPTHHQHDCRRMKTVPPATSSPSPAIVFTRKQNSPDPRLPAVSPPTSHPRNNTARAAAAPGPRT